MGKAARLWYNSGVEIGFSGVREILKDELEEFFRNII